MIFNVLVPGLLGGVDINPKKQGKFAAVSGVQIHAPEWLRSVPEVKTVVVMNPAYEKEIRSQLSSLGVDAKVLLV